MAKIQWTHNKKYILNLVSNRITKTMLFNVFSFSFCTTPIHKLKYHRWKEADILRATVKTNNII